MEVEAVELGLARAAGGDVTEVRLVAKAADAGAGTGRAVRYGPLFTADGSIRWCEPERGE